MKNKALIVGAGGQDGTLLSLLLKRHNYEVHGLKRGELDILNPKVIDAYIKNLKPNEIYYLAAFHHSSESLPPSNGDLFRKSMDIHFHAPVNFLDSVSKISKSTKFFYASSSHVFGETHEGMNTETSVYAPNSEYAITKLAGMRACKFYRDSKNIFASTGILYNHESPLRSQAFLSKKISSTVAKILVKKVDFLEVADLEAKVDWSDARDTVDAMHKILQISKPDDFIVSSGRLHTVRDFVEIAFSYAGLDYTKYVIAKKNSALRKNLIRLGDPSKLINLSGWRPTIDFKTMVQNLVQHEINLININGF